MAQDDKTAFDDTDLAWEKIDKLLNLFSSVERCLYVTYANTPAPEEAKEAEVKKPIQCPACKTRNFVPVSVSLADLDNLRCCKCDSLLSSLPPGLDTVLDDDELPDLVSVLDLPNLEIAEDVEGGLVNMDAPGFKFDPAFIILACPICTVRNLIPASASLTSNFSCHLCFTSSLVGSAEEILPPAAAGPDDAAGEEKVTVMCDKCDAMLSVVPPAELEPTVYFKCPKCCYDNAITSSTIAGN